MTPGEIDLARRIVACGLPVPSPAPKKAIVRNDDGTCFDPEVRVLFVDTGPELLPVLDDYALLGWLITEARRSLDEPHLRTRWSKSGQRWEVYGDSAKWRNIVGYHAGVGETEVAALVAALEAARKEA